MLVNVAEGVLVFCAPLGAAGSGNADRQRALVIVPYLLLQRSPTPPRGYFCPGGSTVVCARGVLQEWAGSLVNASRSRASRATIFSP